MADATREAIDPNGVVTAPDGTVAPCMWFAHCDNQANGIRDAGPLGVLPICHRCAVVVGCADAMSEA